MKRKMKEKMKKKYEKKKMKVCFENIVKINIIVEINIFKWNK